MVVFVGASRPTEDARRVEPVAAFELLHVRGVVVVNSFEADRAKRHGIVALYPKRKRDREREIEIEFCSRRLPDHGASPLLPKSPGP